MEKGGYKIGIKEFKKLSDEELIKLIRNGVEEAHEELFFRYCGPTRGKLINCALPGITTRFCLWDLSGVAFSVYLNCLDSFKIDQGKFYTYYIVSLKHALYRFRDKMFKESDMVLSLDNVLTDNGSGFCLHDVISTSTVHDSPTEYCDYVEMANRIHIALNNMDTSVLNIGKLKKSGLTYQQISEQTGLSIRQVFLRYQKFKDAILKQISM